MRHKAAVILAVLAVFATATSTAAGAALPRLLVADDSTSFSVRPSSVILAADGGILFGKLPSGDHRGYLRWSHWRARSAVGKATYWFKTCVPNCQQSRLRLRHVSILASRPRGGHFSWLRLRMHYKGHLWTELLHCERFGDIWSWVTPEGFVKSAGDAG